MPGLALEDLGASGDLGRRDGSGTWSGGRGSVVLSEVVLLGGVDSFPLGTLAACTVSQHVVKGVSQRAEGMRGRGALVPPLVFLLPHELAQSLGVHRQEGCGSMEDLEADLGPFLRLLLTARCCCFGGSSEDGGAGVLEIEGSILVLAMLVPCG